PGLTPFRRSSRYESRPVARGRGQGDWSDHDEQQEASHPRAGRP
ncbi:daunorubicin/doxorubicin resistance ABC transporter ATP-binding protein DrrA, partial [Micrococcus luteus]